MVRDSSLHCGYHTKRGMDSAEIVVRKVDRECGFHVRKLFRKRVSEHREPAKVHSDSEVLTLNMRRRIFLESRESHFEMTLLPKESTRRAPCVIFWRWIFHHQGRHGPTRWLERPN